jgi:2-polyprenyl-3-methyl-5-hydroxy-6-metoxy-1,4-benzoquinol methylase
MGSDASRLEREGGRELNRAYTGLRKDLLSLVVRAPQSVLDLGCAQGATGSWLKDRYGCRVSGIELCPNMGAHARTLLDEVQVADLNRVQLSELYVGRRFDLILLGDVLEHLVDPWSALREACARLTPDGRIIASLPNVNHYTTLLSLIVMRRWPYRDRGIHDRTHLRFFTRKNLVELYRDAGLTIEHEARNLRLVDRPVGWNSIAHAFDFHPFRGYLTYQYLHRLRPVGQTSDG